MPVNHKRLSNNYPIDKLVQFFTKESIKDHFSEFSSKLENLLPDISEASALKRIKNVLTSTLKELPRSDIFEKKKDGLMKMIKQLDSSPLENIISFLKSELKTYKKICKDEKDYDQRNCYAFEMLEKMEMMLDLVKSLSSELNKFFKHLLKFFSKKVEMYEKLISGYFEYFMNFFTDFKLRMLQYNDKSSISFAFYLINEYNIDHINVTIDFKM